MSIKLQAESKANHYVKYALGDAPNPDEAFSAKEDFMAGYMARSDEQDRLLEFCRSQLRFIEHTASVKGQVELHALISYVLDRIK